MFQPMQGIEELGSKIVDSISFHQLNYLHARSSSQTELSITGALRPQRYYKIVKALLKKNKKKKRLRKKMQQMLCGKTLQLHCIIHACFCADPPEPGQGRLNAWGSC